ncbi:hypothetical protein H4S07_001448, partial [Coemansia furcata]
MSLTCFCAFALVYTVLVVRECVDTLGFVGFALLLTTVIWACKRLADVDALGDIGPNESRCPGTSRFLRQLRLNDIKSRVPHAPVDKTGPVDNDVEGVEPCVPVEETCRIGATMAAAAAVDEGTVVVPTAADEGPAVPAADDDAVACASAAAGPIEPVPAADDDAVTSASVVAGPTVPATVTDDDDVVTGTIVAAGPIAPASATADDDIVAGAPAPAGSTVPAAVNEGAAPPAAADKCAAADERAAAIERAVAAERAAAAERAVAAERAAADERDAAVKRAVAAVRAAASERAADVERAATNECADDDAVAGVPAAKGSTVPAAADEGPVVVPVAADKGADSRAEVLLPHTTVGDDAGGDDSEDAAPHSPTNEAWLISNPRADIYSLRVDTSPHIIVSPLFEYADPSDIYEDAGILLRELRAATSEDESSPIQRIIDDAGAQYDNPSHVCEGLARALDRLANQFQACSIHSEQPAEPVSADSATEQVKSVAHTNSVGMTVPSAGPVSTTDTTEGRKAKRAGKTKNNSPTMGADGTKTTKSCAKKVGGNRASGNKACTNKADGNDKSTSKPPARKDGSALRSKPRADKVSSSEGSASKPGAKKAAGNGKSGAKSRAHNSRDGSANAPHDSKTEDILALGSNKGQLKARRNSVPAASAEPEVPHTISSNSSNVTASASTDQHEVPVTSAGATTQVPDIPEAIERVGVPTAVRATSPLVASHVSGTRVLFASTPMLPVLPRASASEKGKASDRSSADTDDTSSSTMTVNYYETTRVYIPEVSSSKWYMKLFKNAGSQLRGRLDTDVVLQDAKQTIADGAKKDAEPLGSTGALQAVAPPVADAEMKAVKLPVADTETYKESPTNDMDMKEPPVTNVETGKEPPTNDLGMKEPPVANVEMDEEPPADKLDTKEPPAVDAEMEEADADMEEAEAPADGDAEMEDRAATKKKEEEVEVHMQILDAAAVEVEMQKLGRAHSQPRKRRPARAAASTLPINSFGSGAGTLEPNFLFPLAGGLPFNPIAGPLVPNLLFPTAGALGFNPMYPLAGAIGPNLADPATGALLPNPMYPLAGALVPNLLYPWAGAVGPNLMDPTTGVLLPNPMYPLAGGFGTNLVDPVAGTLPFNQGFPQANNVPLAGTAGGAINVPAFTSGLDTLAWVSGTLGENATPAHTLGQAAPGPLPNVNHIDFNALAQGCANAGAGDIPLAGNADTLANIPATLSAEAIAVMRDITR